MPVQELQNHATAEFMAFRCKVTLYQCLSVENCFQVSVGDILEKHEVKALYDDGVNIKIRSRGGGGMSMGAPC